MALVWKSAATAVNHLFILAQPVKKTPPFFFPLIIMAVQKKQQPGEAYFDPELLDKEIGKIDTLRYFRKTIADFDLEDIVIPVIWPFVSNWKRMENASEFDFIDGSHAYESVLSDYNIWANNLITGGYLLFHDIFSDPAKGGQAPYLVYKKSDGFRNLRGNAHVRITGNINTQKVILLI